MLDPAPRFALWQGNGIVCFGDTVKDANIVADIATHTAKTVALGEETESILLVADVQAERGVKRARVGQVWDR